MRCALHVCELSSFIIIISQRDDFHSIAFSYETHSKRRECHLQQDSGFHQDAHNRGMNDDVENIPEISYLNSRSSHMMVCMYFLDPSIVLRTCSVKL